MHLKKLLGASVLLLAVSAIPHIPASARPSIQQPEPWARPLDPINIRKKDLQIRVRRTVKISGKPKRRPGVSPKSFGQGMQRRGRQRWVK